MNDYSDIIRLPHHQSEKHRQMTLHDRAAQFAPFAALTGYEAELSEAARLTDCRLDVGEEDAERINAVLRELTQHSQNVPEVRATYFVPDGKKPGGAYLTHKGKVRRVDTVKRELIFADKAVISIDDIYRLEKQTVQ